MGKIHQLRSLFWGILAGVASAFVAVPAVAEPGESIQLGQNTTLKPQIGTLFNFRSNITQVPTNAIAGLSLNVVPAARLEYSTPDTEFALRGEYRLVKFFTSRLSNADQFNNFDIGVDGRFLKSQPLGFYLHQRVAQVNNNAQRIDSNPFHTRLRNELLAGVEIRPGPVLQFDVLGNLEVDNFRVPPGAQVSGLRNYNTRAGYGGVVRGQWRFFPRTAVVVDSSFVYYDWTRNVIDAGAQGTIIRPNTLHSKVMAGIRGRFTDRLVLVGQIGYGAAPYTCPAGTCSITEGTPAADKVSGIERLLLVAQAQYSIREDRVVTVGYRKDFDDIFFSNYMAYNAFNVGLNSRFGSDLGTTTNLSLRQESYRGQLFRNDVFFDAQADLNYYLQEWAQVTAGVGYQQRLSPSAPSVAYNDVQARIGVTVDY